MPFPPRPQLCRRAWTFAPPGGTSATRNRQDHASAGGLRTGLPATISSRPADSKNAKLSPRCTWMASKETDTLATLPETFIEGAGTTLKAAVDILRKYGAAPESLLPFHITTNLYLGDENTFFATLAASPPISTFRRTWRTGAP